MVSDHYSLKPDPTNPSTDRFYSDSESNPSLGLVGRALQDYQITGRWPWHGLPLYCP